MFRRPIPKRALVGVALGLVYSFFVLPSASSPVGVSLLGVAWFLLAVGLLFLNALAYHAYTLWGLVWVVYKTVAVLRSGGVEWLTFALDVGVPAVSVILVMTSPYLQWVQKAREADELP